MAHKKNRITDDEPEKVLGGYSGNEIVNSMFDGCENWTCKNCGKPCPDKEYHICDFGISQKVCEFCKSYVEINGCGMCMFGRM